MESHLRNQFAFFFLLLLLFTRKKEHKPILAFLKASQKSRILETVPLFQFPIGKREEEKTNRKDKRSIGEFTFWRNALKFHEKEEKNTRKCFIIAVAVFVVDVDSNKNISPALQCIYAKTVKHNGSIYNPNGISNGILWLYSWYFILKWSTFTLYFIENRAQNSKTFKRRSKRSSIILFV